MKRLAIAAVAGMFLLTGCGGTPWNDQLRDLEGISPEKPDSTAIFMSINDFPNIVKTCIDGVAFATTTRLYGDAIMRVPEWDAQCPTGQEK